MTHLLFILLFSVNSEALDEVNYLSCNDNLNQINKTEIASCMTQFENVQSDSLLVDIQNKIYNAFVKDRISQKNDALSELSIQLEDLYKAKNQNLILYWRSYLQFYSSINYLAKGDNKSAENEINVGIELMESIEKKNSEDYALLAMLQSFSIQFNSTKAMYISADVKKNINSAIALDTTNLRAWYVFASNDFYTPEQYGGGKEAEKYLLKAISLPEQKIKNDYLPSWGKEGSYEMLIKIYIKNGKWDLAKKYFQEGITAFPNSYVINQLASKLVGK
jgi:pentatricopeptide repeat protein